MRLSQVEYGPVTGAKIVRDVRVGDVAHGGHCVARHEGKVIFVRGSAPGELVDVEITQDNARYSRGTAVAVRDASDIRRVPPCPVAGSCGGCDFQHLDPAGARALKSRVVAEQLRRVPGVHFDGVVRAAQPDDAGWRVRMRYEAAPDGTPGLRRHRSHDIVPVPPDGCRIAAAPIARPRVAGIAASTASGPVWAAASGQNAVVHERVGTREFSVHLDGFWQPHAAAPQVLTDAVLAHAVPREGETALDLYCGVGVFAAALTDAGCRVTGIEGNREAVALARTNVPEGTFHAGDVARTLTRIPPGTDVVVLDPPRTGAGPAVLRALCAHSPRVIVYVACDPAALARDLLAADAAGYRADVAAYDLFPNTHHVECVATLRRA